MKCLYVETKQPVVFKIVLFYFHLSPKKDKNKNILLAISFPVLFIF